MINQKLFFQIGRFGFVGAMAAIVHFSIVVAIVEWGHIHPLVANVFAYLIAFNVSYFGHRFITFTKATAPHGTAITKLFLMGTVNLIINQGLFALFLEKLHMNYMIALAIAIGLVSIMSFILSKFWVFKERHQSNKHKL